MEVQQVDENESFTNVMAQLDDNAQDEDDDLENDEGNDPSLPLLCPPPP